MFPKTRQKFLNRMKNLQELGGFLPPGSLSQKIYNEENQLHSETQPAFRSATRIVWYRNGQLHGLSADIFGSVVYFWKNVLIPDRYFLHPESLTLVEILCHPNVEVRSVGLEIYGYERMERSNEFIVVDKDEVQERCLLKFESPELHEPLMVVRVKNKTPEPDGSYSKYYLCVPNTMTSCQEAVAWTFAKAPSEYNPEIET